LRSNPYRLRLLFITAIRPKLARLPAFDKLKEII
jgi:hypothetical protein